MLNETRVKLENVSSTWTLPTYTTCFFSQQQSVVQGYHDGPSAQAANEDDDAAEKEKKEENDDEETLQKARDWDEWKDGKILNY